ASEQRRGAPQERSAGHFAGGGYAVLRQQRADVGAAAAELDEGLQGIPAAPAGKDGIQEPPGGGAIEHAALLERREGIRGEDLRPLVAVVAGRVAAGEDVSEAVREA